ncbi:MAG: hypothetical protein ACLR6I_07790 [Waltera sp.]
MDILSLTAVELAKAIREGKTTSVEATQAVLDKIAASEDTYHCYVTVEREKALQQAAEVQKNRSGRTDQGLWPGSLCYQRQYVHRGNPDYLLF